MPRVYAIDGVIPVVDPSSYVHPSAVLIGDVIVGPDCYVGPGASLRGDFGRIAMGRGSSFQDSCTAHGFVGEETRIGEYCNIGHGAVLHGCEIRDRVLVGMNAVVMDGAIIEEDALVAALAFVPAATVIPARVIAAGTPAKVVRPLTEGEMQWKADGTRDYMELTVRCRETMEAVDALTEIDSDEPRLRVRGSAPLYVTRREKAG